MSTRLQIEYLATDALRPYERNPRTHSAEQVAQLADAIREFGWTNPILISDDREIIAGHGRWMAAQKLGLEQVPTVRLTGMSAEQRRAYVIADNQLALKAGWDHDILRQELAALGELDFDLGKIGFDEDELRVLLADLSEDSEGFTDDDAAPEVPIEPTSRPGDVWICGPHRVMCGDATVMSHIETLMAGDMADMLLTDPPYNVAYEGKTKDALTIKNDKMSSEAFRLFLRDAFTTAHTVMKPGAAFYIWHAASETANFVGAATESALRVRQTLVWVKNAMVLGRQDYHWRHEPCLYGWKDGASHKWCSDRKQTTVLEFERPTQSVLHPTMKPVVLFAYQMLNNTDRNNVVLDPFGGSGTTLIASHKHRRRARIMELDPRYCDVIVRRWQDFTGERAVNEATGERFKELDGEE